jgi:hypothetical protein
VLVIVAVVSLDGGGHRPIRAEESEASPTVVASTATPDSAGTLPVDELTVTAVEGCCGSPVWTVDHRLEQLANVPSWSLNPELQIPLSTTPSGEGPQAEFRSEVTDVSY